MRLSGDLEEEVLLVLTKFKEVITLSAIILYSLVIVSILPGLGFSTAYAQETSTVISSDPPGASITLEGEYNLSATTPCRLPDNVNGKFELKANMSGYESWSGDVIILPGQENHFSFSLAPKTRLKAAFRSLFMPGWGQYYAGLKEKAFILNIGTIGFAIGTVLVDSDFRQKRDDYNQAVVDLNNASSYDEVSRLRSLVIDKNRQAYDAETRRNALAIITAGLWAYNILDAVIFFPDKKLYFHQGGVPVQGASIRPVFDGDKIGLSLTAAF